jgi:hypothetical protein
MGGHRIVLAALHATAATALLLLAASGHPPSPVFAEEGPTQTIAKYAPPPDDCITGNRTVASTEWHVKFALPGEWQPFWDEDALKAGASIIRQDLWYKHRHPETDWFDFCPGVTPYSFDTTTGYILGYMVAKVPPCNPGPVQCYTTNAATDATKTMGWDAWDSDGVRPNDLELRFAVGTCVADETRYLAENLGKEWREIVGSPVYPPGVYGGYPGSSDPTFCGDTPEDQFDNRVYPPLIANCLYNPSNGDSDCDGFTDSREAFIGTDYQGRCGEGYSSGPSTMWPLDFKSGGIFDSTDRVTIDDLNTFLSPRRLGWKQGDWLYVRRWDLAYSIFGNAIGIEDLNAMIAGPTGLPAMFGGDHRALSGPRCSNHPDYGD